MARLADAFDKSITTVDSKVGPVGAPLLRSVKNTEHYKQRTTLETDNPIESQSLPCAASIGNKARDFGRCDYRSAAERPHRPTEYHDHSQRVAIATHIHEQA